jgi:hypothetical protein
MVTTVSTQTVTVQTPIDLPPDLYDLKLAPAGGQVVILEQAFALYTAQPVTTCFFDDFKSGLGKWVKAEDGGEWDIVASDGWEAMTDSPNHPYHSAEQGETVTTTLISQIFDLSNCGTSVLTLKHAHQLSDSDSIYVDFSPDAGSTWHSIFSQTGNDFVEVATVADNEWSRVVTDALTLTINGPQIPTSTTTARLRFRLVANDFGSAKGWLIDEVVIHSAPPTPADMPTPTATPTSTPETPPALASTPTPIATPPITPTPNVNSSIHVYLPLVTKR